MGLRSGLLNLGPPRRCVADLAAPIQLAPAAQQSKIKSAHQPPRSYRGQPVEAPQLAETTELVRPRAEDVVSPEVRAAFAMREGRQDAHLHHRLFPDQARFSRIF